MKKYFNKSMFIASAFLTSTTIVSAAQWVPDLALSRSKTTPTVFHEVEKDIQSARCEWDETGKKYVPTERVQTTQPVAAEKTAASILQQIDHKVYHDALCDWDEKNNIYVLSWSFKDEIKKDFSTLLGFGKYSATNTTGLTPDQCTEAVGYVTHLGGFDLEISMLGDQSTVNPFMVINKHKTGAVSFMTTNVLEYIFSFASISKDSAPGIADIFEKVACMNTQFDKRVTFPLPSKLEHKKPKAKEKEQQRTRLNTLLQGIKSSLSKSGHEIRIETVLNTLDKMSVFKNFVTSLDPNDPLRQDFDAQHSDLEMFASALLQETEDQPRDQEEYCNSDQAKEDMKGMIHQLLTWDGQTIDHFDLQGPQDAYQLVQVIYTVLEDVQQNPQAYNAENNIDQIIQSGESLAEFLHKKFQLVRYV